MFSTFASALKIASNLVKIKETVSSIYLVITKTITVIDFLSSQTNETKLGKLLAKYIPTISTILSKTKEVIEKLAPLLQITLSAPVVALTAETVSEDEAKQILDSALDDLNNLLK
jgi:hypothetical protein